MRAKGARLHVVSEGLARDLEIVMQQLELGVGPDSHPEDARRTKMRECAHAAHIEAEGLKATRHASEGVTDLRDILRLLLSEKLHREMNAVGRHPRNGIRGSAKGRRRVVDRLPLRFGKINRDEEPHGQRRRRPRAQGA